MNEFSRRERRSLKGSDELSERELEKKRLGSAPPRKTLVRTTTSLTHAEVAAKLAVIQNDLELVTQQLRRAKERDGLASKTKAPRRRTR